MLPWLATSHMSPDEPSHDSHESCLVDLALRLMLRPSIRKALDFLCGNIGKLPISRGRFYFVVSGCAVAIALAWILRKDLWQEGRR